MRFIVFAGGWHTMKKEIKILPFEYVKHELHSGKIGLFSRFYVFLNICICAMEN